MLLPWMVHRLKRGAAYFSPIYHSVCLLTLRTEGTRPEDLGLLDELVASIAEPLLIGFRIAHSHASMPAPQPRCACVGGL